MVSPFLAVAVVSGGGEDGLRPSSPSVNLFNNCFGHLQFCLLCQHDVIMSVICVAKTFSLLPFFNFLVAVWRMACGHPLLLLTYSTRWGPHKRFSYLLIFHNLSPDQCFIQVMTFSMTKIESASLDFFMT